MNKEFTHIDSDGNAFMVDVSEKSVTERIAKASGSITLCPEAYDKVRKGQMKKGDVLTVAQVAGIMGAKRTSDLIPMCHNIGLSNAKITFSFDDDACTITALCTAKTAGLTGVEMEALTGVSVTLLTIYDMCKAIDKRMVMSDIHLLSKSGGKSGDFVF